MMTYVPAVESIHDKFLCILPRIREHGRIFFRHVRVRDKKEDLITEMVALCWKWIVRLAQRGKDATQFASVLASYAARAILNGRRLCGSERLDDALSPRAQQRHGFTVAPLPPGSNLIGNAFDERCRITCRPRCPIRSASDAIFRGGGLAGVIGIAVSSTS